MPGLFSTPEETYAAQSQLQDQQARGYAALGADNAGAYLGMRAGQQIGGLLSGPDPAMQRSYLVQDALKEVNGSDAQVGTPKYFDALVKALSKRSLTNDALSVTDYAEKMRGERAKSGLAEAAAEKDRAQTDRDRAAMALLTGGDGTTGQAPTGPEQLSGPDMPGALGGGSKLPFLQNPDALKAYGTITNRPEFITHGERLEKKAETEKTLALAKDPATGLFTPLFDDPNVGKMARQAQGNLTDGKLDYTNAQSLYKNMSERATALAVAQKTAKEKSDEVKLDPAALKIAATKSLYFGVDPKGMGNLATVQRTQVTNEMARQAGELGLSPLEAAMLPQDNKIKMKAVDALTKWGAFVGKSSDKLERDLGVAIDYAQQLNPGRIQFINKAVLSGRKEFNDPAANAYASAINSVRTEYSRMMSGPTSNAMLPVEALKTGNELLSRGVDVPSLIEVGKQMKRDATNTVLATNDQINSLRGSVMSAGRTPGLVPGGGGSQFQEGQTATGRNGQKIVFKGGQWEPMQ